MVVITLQGNFQSGIAFQ